MSLCILIGKTFLCVYIMISLHVVLINTQLYIFSWTVLHSNFRNSKENPLKWHYARRIMLNIESQNTLPYCWLCWILKVSIVSRTADYVEYWKSVYFVVRLIMLNIESQLSLPYGWICWILKVSIVCRTADYVEYWKSVYFFVRLIMLNIES